MSINNKKILKMSDVNITWTTCSRCGVLCFKSDWCKPCQIKIQLLDTYPLKSFALNTLVDILNEVVLHVCKIITHKTKS